MVVGWGVRRAFALEHGQYDCEHGQLNDTTSRGLRGSHKDFGKGVSNKANKSEPC